jgi:hypothetical protein
VNHPSRAVRKESDLLVQHQANQRVTLTKEQRQALYNVIDYRLGSDIDAMSLLDQLLDFQFRHGEDVTLAKRLQHWSHDGVEVAPSTFNRIVWSCIEYCDGSNDLAEGRRVLAGVLAESTEAAAVHGWGGVARGGCSG